MSTNDPCPCPEKQLVIKDEELPENSPPKPDCIPIIVNPPDPSDIPGKCDSKIRFQTGQNGCPGRYWGYVCESGWIGFSYDIPSCIKATDGMPTEPPLECDLPIKYDACTGIFWYYTCEGGWKKEAHTLCFLEHLDDLPANICDQIKVPLFFNDPCCNEGFLTLKEFVAQIWACGCPPEGSSITPGDGKLILYCNGDSVVIGTLDINFCSLFGQVDSGSGMTVESGGSITIFDPVSCTTREVTFEPPPTECCACHISEGFLAGGGACFNISATGTPENPAIFQGRDLSFISGTGNNTFDLNGVGLKSEVITNPYSDCPCLARVTMTGLANRSLNNPNAGVGFAFIISETLEKPLPYINVTTSAGSPTSVFAFNPRNAAFLTLDVINNFNITPTNPGDNADYSAFSSRVMTWDTQLAIGQSKVMYGQWWAFFSGAATGLIGHASMDISVDYIEGGVSINPNQI